MERVDVVRLPDQALGAEPDPPYARPPLSKGLWKGEPLEGIWRGTGQAGALLHLGRRVTAIDLAARTVLDDHGHRYGFEKIADIDFWVGQQRDDEFLYAKML